MSEEENEEIFDINETPTITAADLEPPVCAWCETELTTDTEVHIWDIKERGTDGAIWRYRYCSKSCRMQDKHQADDDPKKMHPYGTPERLTLEDRDAYR